MTYEEKMTVVIMQPKQWAMLLLGLDELNYNNMVKSSKLYRLQKVRDNLSTAIRIYYRAVKNG